MQRPSSAPQPAANPVLAGLRERFGDGAWVSLEVFVEAALYAPEVGYYRRPRVRVGHRADRDFYTASSLGPVFAELVLDAVLRLLPGAAADHTFVEVGAEPESHLVQHAARWFGAHREIRLGDPLELEGRCVIFSNELFDAQPFRRFRREEGRWREIGVWLEDATARLAPAPGETELPAELPETATEGYLLDYPSGARRLIRTLADGNWQGLFLAFDYGLDWQTLAHLRPEGTARTYRAHRLGTDLLAAPGDHDITHHICWDHLTEALGSVGFETSPVQSQEGFFMHHATEAIARMIESDMGRFSPARQTLKTLLHPENMGRKFQVMRAQRV